MRDRRTQHEDDGRTIADMSALEGRNLFGLGGKGQPFKRENGRPSGEPRQSRPWENHSLSCQERWAAVFGAWKAAILIALAYIIGLGLLIWAMTALMG